MNDSDVRGFIRRSGDDAKVVWVDADGIAFGTFEAPPENLDLADPSASESASELVRIRWDDVRRVQKSESRAIHVEAADGAEQFATWNVDEIWAEVRARAPDLQPSKQAAPSVGAGWWLKLGGAVGVLGAAIASFVFWLGGQAWLWEAPEGRVKLKAAAIVWLFRSLAWLGPWPWVVITAVACAFALFGAFSDGKDLPEDDVLVRE